MFDSGCFLSFLNKIIYGSIFILCCSCGSDPESDFSETPEDTLIWEDNFDDSGTINLDKWTYETGNGCPNLCGWGNGESQYYTARSENVRVEDGLLKLQARRENYRNSSFTSARIKTQGLFQFTYGKVEVRAKLPSGGGVWPAIWMLGSNITSVGWPRCGEIDIMEFAGNRPGSVSAAIHNASSYGNTQYSQSQSVNSPSDEFHIYEIQWDADKIQFFIDGERFYVYSPYPKTPENWPFDADHFIILNVAMGGSYGGSISSDFESSAMEIDYVRVYQ